MKWRVALVLWGAVVGGTLAWGAAGGAEPRAWFNLYPAESGGKVTVTVESEFGGVQGWSFGLCHEPGKARILSFGLSPELESIRHGSPPDFVVCEEATRSAPRAGIVQAAVLAYRDLTVLPARAGGYPVLDVDYELLGDGPSGLQVCDGLQGSGQPVGLVITINGESYAPARAASATLTRAARNAWFNAAPPVTDSSVTVSVESTNADISGWSVGLCHDPYAAAVTGFDKTPELATLLQGSPSAFYHAELAAGADREGVVQAVAFGASGDVSVLPARPGGFPVLRVTYVASSETSVQVCAGLKGSGEPVDLVLTAADGTTLRPSRPAGATVVPRTPASQLAYRTDPEESSEVVTVKLYTGALSVQGWAFALCHRDVAAQVLEARTSPEVESLVGGEPPEFVLEDVVPVGPYVAVRQNVVLGTSSEPLAVGPFPDGIPLLGIRYRVLRDDTLKFCDTDPEGTMELENQVLVEGIRWVPLTRRGSRLVTNALGTSFIRGDADLSGKVQLTDAIVILLALFTGGRPLPCLDAADANDVARVDISDPIFILYYLFMGGPEPPPPYPEPGQDLSPQTALGCERGM